jgi:hypothetical protein
MGSAAMTMAAFAWGGAIGLAIIGFACHSGDRSASAALSGTVLHASTAGDGLQRVVVGIVDRRSRPDAILQLGLDRGDLAEGQRIQVGLRSGGRVRLWVHPCSMSLSRPLLAYVGSAQLAVVGLLILTVPR